MVLRTNHLLAAVFAATLLLQPALASAQPAGLSSAEPTFADIADMADSAGMVLLVRVAKQIAVKDERAPGLQPGHRRFYMEAETRSLLTGGAPIGGSVKYLVDLPLDDRGKAPKLKKQDVFLFARPVPGRPGEVQLVTPTSQRPWTAAGEERLRSILRQLVSPNAPAKITGVRELLYVPGNLQGQGETQIFLATKDGSAASISVRHEPGAPPAWGVSFSELVANVGNPPRKETLEWYRLACFLPSRPPAAANISASYGESRQAEADYRMVLGELGPCERNLAGTR
jgi:hypothetical protein